MVFTKMEHLVKVANEFWSNATWFTTLCIYLLPIHPPIYLANIYLLITHPPTHPPTYYLPTYLLIYLYLFTVVQPTYLCTHLVPTYYLPIHPFTYLSLTTKCSY
jgi:hypothetical protein